MPGKQPRGETRRASRIQRGLEMRAGWWDRLLEQPVLWGVLAVAAATWMLLPPVGPGLPQWAEGEVATADVSVAQELVLPDEAATEILRQEARERVLPVYDLEPRVDLELIAAIHLVMETCRTPVEDEEGEAVPVLDSPDLTLPEGMAAVLNADGCSPEMETALVDVVARLHSRRLVDDLRALGRRGEEGVVVRNLATDIERTESLTALGDVVDYRTGLEPTLRAMLLDYDVVRRGWLAATTEFLEANIQPSLVFNRAETSQRAEAAAGRVAARSQILKRGQILVRRGDTVTTEVARTLRLMRAQGRGLPKYSTLVGIFLLVGLTVVCWWWLLGRLGGIDRRHRMSAVCILIILSTAMLRAGLFLATAIALKSQGPAMSMVEVYLWGLPYAAGAVMAVLLLGLEPAILFALFSSLFAAIMLGGDFAFVPYALGSGLAGALLADRFEGRAVFPRVGALVGVANLGMFVVLQLYLGVPGPAGTLALAGFCAAVGGPVAVALVAFLLPVLERLFGITTDLRLLELSNQNLPLLKRLSLEAPGTYQHSLAVGNLAEAGAEAVGANGLLLRVCSYYHDVGKLVKPEYFVENQRGRNPHDSLSPSMSALVILSHVKEGLEIARRESLPLPIRQAIATHHGTKLIRYFFNKARETAAPDLGEIRESEYRYPGPRPHTKELGILLLADAVEAAARTLETPSPSKIQHMIDRIFTDAVEDDQLDDSELTFREMDKIASAFLWVLANMYHHRIDYPGFNFNQRSTRRDSGSHRMGTKTRGPNG